MNHRNRNRYRSLLHLALAATLSLAACDGRQPAQPTTSNPTPSPDATTPPPIDMVDLEYEQGQESAQREEDEDMNRAMRDASQADLIERDKANEALRRSLEADATATPPLVLLHEYDPIRAMREAEEIRAANADATLTPAGTPQVFVNGAPVHLLPPMTVPWQWVTGWKPVPDSTPALPAAQPNYWRASESPSPAP